MSKLTPTAKQDLTHQVNALDDIVKGLRTAPKAPPQAE